ncbi:MAG: 3-hydroxyacyl-CoA dehydrogenase NAD-binding domain-containing protein [Desulfatiglans sp.]|jgi:3-hydroxyacyl-CoA dehydrogenase/enoyl-CoA hydratase/carnithine racemase|nr:3-hydroxyacyl-CoA dehydrogenase NAD-binding domain-containing protein [Desulfatiglans sp.]
MERQGRVFSFLVEDDLAMVTFDDQGDVVNTWTAEALEDFSELMDALEGQRENIKGIIFASGKKANFHAGANLKMISEKGGADKLIVMVDKLHEAFLRLENFGVPSLAVINGHCLGGGYEFALAMTARMATDSPGSVIGLPECNVGLYPGGGGTQRLPRLIGYPAIELILQGKVVPAAKALDLGMVDKVVSAESDLQAEAKTFMKDIIEGRSAIKRAQQDFSGLDEAIGAARKAVLKATRGRELPAHMLALKAMQEGLKVSLKDSIAIEKKYFLEVIASPEAMGSINTFFLKTYTDKPKAMIPKGFEPKPIKKVAMLGFGAMGRGIVIDILRCMQVPVVVKDLPEALEPGKAFIRKILSGMAEKGRLKGSVDSLMDLIIPVSDWTEDFKDVDLVIEAVFEDPAVKAEVYEELCNTVSEDCLIATNTSSIPVNLLAKNVMKPERFCGAHFFSPVWMMQLLEIIEGDATSPDTINSLLNFCASIRKRPVVCKDYPGFVVNAMLFPYFMKTYEILESGVPIEKIDRAMQEFGLPVGPIRLTDEVGIDIIHSVFTKSLGLGAPQTIENVIKDGRLGLKKSGKGFFLSDGSVDPEVLPLIPVSSEPKDFAADEIRDLLFRPFVEVGKQLLDQGIVKDPRSIDIGAIWGIGFPADKGGPMKWADMTGLSKELYGSDFY